MNTPTDAGETDAMTAIAAATDFSDDARHALERAGLIAAEQGARLDVLHVMNASSLASLRALLGPHVDAEARLMGDAGRMLGEVAAEIGARFSIETAPRMQVGEVLEEIVKAGQAADLLVLGAHGLNPLRDLILGTTAERLLRKCRRPVLIARPAPAGPYQNVLVPVDFSAHSLPALRMAVRIAPEARITLVHAFDVPFEGKLRWAGVTEDEIRAYREHARQQAQTALDALIAEVDGRGHFTRAVAPGSAEALILSSQKELDADLIVIGKHGKSLVEELFLGSVTRHVLEDARCDVLVVHEPPPGV